MGSPRSPGMFPEGADVLMIQEWIVDLESVNLPVVECFRTCVAVMLLLWRASDMTDELSCEC